MRQFLTLMAVTLFALAAYPRVHDFESPPDGVSSSNLLVSCAKALSTKLDIWFSPGDRRASRALTKRLFSLIQDPTEQSTFKFSLENGNFLGKQLRIVEKYSGVWFRVDSPAQPGGGRKLELVASFPYCVLGQPNEKTYSASRLKQHEVYHGLQFDTSPETYAQDFAGFFGEEVLGYLQEEHGKLFVTRLEFALSNPSTAGFRVHRDTKSIYAHERKLRSLTGEHYYAGFVAEGSADFSESPSLTGNKRAHLAFVPLHPQFYTLPLQRRFAVYWLPVEAQSGMMVYSFTMSDIEKHGAPEIIRRMLSGEKAQLTTEVPFEFPLESHEEYMRALMGSKIS